MPTTHDNDGDGDANDDVDDAYNDDVLVTTPIKNAITVANFDAAADDAEADADANGIYDDDYDRWQRWYQHQRGIWWLNKKKLWIDPSVYRSLGIVKHFVPHRSTDVDEDSKEHVSN